MVCVRVHSHRARIEEGEGGGGGIEDSSPAIIAKFLVCAFDVTTDDQHTAGISSHNRKSPDYFDPCVNIMRSAPSVRVCTYIIVYTCPVETVDGDGAEVYIPSAYARTAIIRVWICHRYTWYIHLYRKRR